MDQLVNTLQERIRAAQASQSPLVIGGGNSKSFYGGAIVGEAIDMRTYSGIIDYQPRELVLTVRAGTPLAEIERVMEAESQLLPFEPPQFAEGATIGGTVATGLSGPRRAYTGAVRDFVLGTRIIDGKGDDLHFGGRVIKNVAGYDVSRLMTGAMGTLGVLLDISFKVLPKPTAEATLRFEMEEAGAIQQFNTWAGQPLPLSATAWSGGVANVRLSGTEAGVAAARAKLGGEAVASVEAATFWASLRDHRQAFFSNRDQPLWRLSVPATTKPFALDAPVLIEWGGALRWMVGDADAPTLRAQIAALGGHVTLMRGADKSCGVFHPLAGKIAEIHRNLKRAFDPADILNRGRMDNL
jgi:glycolate oxidase FAD binding subunit